MKGKRKSATQKLSKLPLTESFLHLRIIEKVGYLREFWELPKATGSQFLSSFKKVESAKKSSRILIFKISTRNIHRNVD